MTPLDSLIEHDCIEGQPFGANFNPSYAAQHLTGHTGIDISCGYGSPIQAVSAGLVYSTYPINQPASDGYTAVFTLCSTRLEVFEFSYGHVSEINCGIGQSVGQGDVIALEGNHGTVFSGNIQITPRMQAAGDHRGAHRHYQKRPVIRVPHTRPGYSYLQTAHGIYYDYALGPVTYYEIVDYGNGFNGCVDWSAPLFTRTLLPGSAGYDVLLVQRAMVREDFATYTPTGTFGPLTFASVMRYQRAHGLQALGIVGPMTRAALNAAYTPL